ncbi:MAG TPA: succinyldiaminopimelate transaminase [Gammaproteobacteria bacterium]|nr:succinyldiaminopimelate transaminase [Gammaproteobacteria bacterium]
MNPELDRLHPYPFARLARLKQGIQPPGDRSHIALSIGEPRHAPPGFIARELLDHLDGLASYPATKGTAQLRETIAQWLARRYDLAADAVDAQRQVLPVNGTREALFAFAQAVVDRSSRPLVIMPNPFYQIYEGAALLAGAEPWYLNATAETGFVPDFDAVPDSVWRRCQLLYLCSPGNPTGAVADLDTLQRLIQLADRHDFIIASDECYSEIYFDDGKPPPGLLQAAAALGNHRFERCVVFHSLSKRSSVPGLRSGFVAGDAGVLERFLLYRTYHGSAMPLPTQAASIAAWSDEQHVLENRLLYRRKFAAVLEVLSPVMEISQPEAGFYLWAGTGSGDTDFARELYARQNVTVLPGSYLSREAHGINPGRNRVRMALVAQLEECVEAARRIRNFIENRDI